MNNLSPEELYKREGWTIIHVEGKPKVEVDGYVLDAVHPYHVHAAVYRKSNDKEIKFRHIKAMHDIAWPHYVPYWNHWIERIFRALCDPKYSVIVLASGASCGKSKATAMWLYLDFTSDMYQTGGVVASTDLDSLEKRIYGYVREIHSESKAPVTLYETSGQKPKIKSKRNDKVHCIAAVPSKKGGEAQSINHLIGTHPKRRIRMVIDEGTDCPPQVMAAKSNLEQGVESIKIIIIGNSDNKNDLHGSQATPKGGNWDLIDWKTHDQWETEAGGLCLYFNPYKSPAIWRDPYSDPPVRETDPWRLENLGRIFWTEAKIQKSIDENGEDSKDFYRMCLGFWAKTSQHPTFMTRQLLSEFHAEKAAHWAGIRTLYKVAGLDPAFSQGGDKCVLRIATLGTDIYGRVLLDFKEHQQLFYIPILATSKVSPEIQIADKVLPILKYHNIRLDYLAVDANGQGRGIADIISMRARSVYKPLKIWATKSRSQNKQIQLADTDMMIMSSLELWNTLGIYIKEDSIRGLDILTLEQLCNRRVIYDSETHKEKLEPKKEYKLRMGAKSPRLAHSPDEADATCITLQAAILKYGFIPGQTDTEIVGENYIPESYLGEQYKDQADPQNLITAKASLKIQGFKHGWKPRCSGFRNR